MILIGEASFYYANDTGDSPSTAPAEEEKKPTTLPVSRMTARPVMVLHIPHLMEKVSNSQGTIITSIDDDGFGHPGPDQRPHNNHQELTTGHVQPSSAGIAGEYFSSMKLIGEATI